MTLAGTTIPSAALTDGAWCASEGCQSFKASPNRFKRLAFVKILMLHSNTGKFLLDDSEICVINLYWAALGEFREWLAALNMPKAWLREMQSPISPDFPSDLWVFASVCVCVFPSEFSQNQVRNIYFLVFGIEETGTSCHTFYSRGIVWECLFLKDSFHIGTYFKVKVI